MVFPLSLGYLANVVLGLGLGVLAGLALRGDRPQPGRGLLASYLALVGANYLLDGMSAVAYGADLAGLHVLLVRLSIAAAILDPPVLLLFAATEAGLRVRAWAFALLAAPSLAILLAAADPFALVSARVAYALLLVACYGGAFLLLARSRLRTDALARQAHLDALLLVLGPVTLARLPLAYVDLGFAIGREGRAALSTLAMEGALVAVFLLVVLAFLAAGRAGSRHGPRRVLLPLGALLGVVALVWALRFVPALRSTAFAFLFSVRWYLFFALLVSAPHRRALLGDSPGAGRLVRVILALLLGAVAFSASSSLVAALAETTLADALLTGSVVVLLGVGVAVAFRVALPRGREELSSRRVSVYRAQLELGAAPEDLERLRTELGLSKREAGEVEFVSALERTLAPAVEGPRPGEVFLGRYRVGRVVGVGAFGRAWSAEDVADGGDVVLKELREEWRENPRALRRFVKEVRSAMRVRHPNLVAFRGLERHAGGFVLVLERVAGETLRDRLARGSLDEAQAARLARDLLSGLAALHASGIVHRDVKPENVVLKPDGHAVLLDLGAAADDANPTADDGAMGTPAYMSPEEARGGTATTRGDVYALGVVLWEALAGAPPPRGRVPAAWRDFLARALDPDPERRFADAATALRALSAGAPRDAAA